MSNGDRSKGLRPGKLPPALLAELLGQLPTQDADLVLGPAVGEDAAVSEFARSSARLLVAKCDPITFATDQIGFYAVHVCANDLAVTGATPRFFLPTLLLPAAGATVELAQQLFAQIGAACRSLGVVVAGGHSEVTPAVTQPVVLGTMLGEVERRHQVCSGGCRPGDVLLLAGKVPVEGTSVLARERRSQLLAAGWDAAELEVAANYLFDPGISVLRPALLAAHAGWVTAMHDPTEGGLATGLAELATAGQVGLQVDLDAVAISGLSRRLCAALGLDPLGTLASGALLATAHPDQVDALLAGWEEAGWPAAAIGQILPPGSGLWAMQQGERLPLPAFQADELTRLWQ